jgi:hypothetical protein
MSRAEELRALFEAELAVAELEEQLVAAKDTDDGPTRELKLELRAARERFRRLRSGEPVEGVATPATIEAKAGLD